LLNPGLRDLWAGFFDIGLSAARGNARTNTFTTAFSMARLTRTDKTNLYFNQIYSTATVAGVSANVAQAVRGGVGYNRNVSRRGFLNAFNDYEFDKFQNLDLRFVLGGGAGYTAVKNERSQLDVLGGAAYNREKFDRSTQPPAGPPVIGAGDDDPQNDCVAGQRE
jgi:putative salt-induced outer membrane protein